MDRVSRKDMGTVENPFVGGDERARRRCRTQQKNGVGSRIWITSAVSLDISLSDVSFPTR